jgi:cell division transport system permease protein
MAHHPEKVSRFRLTTLFISTVFSISLVLFLLALLGTILFHAQRVSTYVRENIGFSVMMHQDVRESEILNFQKTLDAAAFVKSTEYIPKEKAADELAKELGEDFIDFMGYNPLPSSIEVRLNADYTQNDSLAKIEENLLKNPAVKEIFYQKHLVEKVNANIDKITLIMLSLSGFLLLISILLINSTIRLSIYSKRFIIKSMLLVGASSRFIREPFILKGIYQGLWAGILAAIYLFGVLWIGNQYLPEIIDFKDIDSYLSIFGIVVLFGILFSWISTSFSVRKIINMKTDNLYY